MSTSNERAAALYLDLLKKALVNSLYAGANESGHRSELSVDQIRAVRASIRGAERTFDRARRDSATFLDLGEDRIRDSAEVMLSRSRHTMLEPRYLDTLQECIETALRDGVPGDLIEAGVWRGGATIFMRGVLEAHGIRDRVVWAADSFAGLPAVDASVSVEDAVGFELIRAFGALEVSLAEVQDNFRRYGLLDAQVRFLEGWFEQTLPGAPIERLSVARLDGDWYTSTSTCLTHLYPKVSIGGFVIIDDYGLPLGCRRAVDEYRRAYGIEDPLVEVGQTAFWRVSADARGRADAERRTCRLSGDTRNA